MLSTLPPPADVERNVAVALRTIRLMSYGTPEELAAVIHPGARNGDPVLEPTVRPRRGPAAFLAAAERLQSAYDGAAWRVYETVADGDLVVLHTAMTGKHTGVFVVHGRNGAPTLAFPPTGREFAVTQTHWMRLADGLVIDHWANRDDLGMARQLGWFSPRYVWRILGTTCRTRRAHRRALRRKARSRG